MKNILAFCVAFVVLSAVAFAGPVDILFTGTNWTTQCTNCGGTSPQGKSSVNWDIGNGFTLTIAAWVYDAANPFNSVEFPHYAQSTLWWDSTDGFGVNSGSVDYQTDEINFPEVLSIQVNGGTLPANRMYLTDLFNETRGATSYLEQGFWSTTPITSTSGASLNGFFADPSQLENTFPFNGEQTVDLGGLNLGTLYLSAPGQSVPGQSDMPDSEYSIAGLNLTTSVPEPSTMMLLGFGLLVGAPIMRKFARF